MNVIVNKFLLAGDKFMPECIQNNLDLNIVLVVCSLNNNKNRIKKFKETGDSGYIYQNELDKTCVQHDMPYGQFKDLNRRTITDKVLRESI